jgi:hypothetical protein
MTYEEQALFPSEGSSVEGSPAKISLLLANVLVWPVGVPVYSGKLSASLVNSNQSGSSLKTSLVSCHLTEDETWEPSSGRWASSGMGSPTECWTLSSSESPSVAVECSLSDVLETTGSHLQKYLLSAKACAGILRRATRRGKQLPEALQAALEQVAN